MIRTAGLCLVLLLGGACNGLRKAPPTRQIPPPTAVAAEAHVHHAFAEYQPVEIAVVRPTGDPRRDLVGGVREGLYQGLLDRNFSPLDPDYVDRSVPRVDVLSGPCVMQSQITEARRSEGGGMTLSGWAALVFPSPGGGETLYLLDIQEFHVPPESGGVGGVSSAVAGRRFGLALLAGLPSR